MILKKKTHRLSGIVKDAVVAQSVEHLIGNEEVSGSSPPNSFKENQGLQCFYKRHCSFFYEFFYDVLIKLFTIH